MIIRGRAEKKHTTTTPPPTNPHTPKKKVKTELSREQTALLKGAAIWFIMLHNYCRRLDFVPRENEFSWSPDGPLLFMQHIAAPHPLRLALDTLAFLGHYGVPLFIFLSGYGLVKKYGTFPARQPAALPYMRRNARKFWRLMLPALLLHIVMQTILTGTFPFSPLHLTLQILFLTNLNPAGTAYPGPYWYFGMTMQLYLLYRLCIHRLSARGLLLLSVASLLPQALLLALPPHTPWAQSALDYLRTNAVGALPPFCMGVYAARRGLPPAPPHPRRHARTHPRAHRLRQPQSLHMAATAPARRGRNPARDGAPAPPRHRPPPPCMDGAHIRLHFRGPPPLARRVAPPIAPRPPPHRPPRLRCQRAHQLVALPPVHHRAERLIEKTACATRKTPLRKAEKLTR